MQRLNEACCFHLHCQLVQLPIPSEPVSSQNFPGPQFPAPLNTRTNDYSLWQGGYEAKGGGRALCCFLGMARTPAPRSHSFQEEKAEQGRAALGSTRAETRSPLQLLKK